MKSIAFFNNKGGVGKTTLLCNVAAYLGKVNHKKVLVIDADPQCNTTTYILTETQFLKVYYKPTDFTIADLVPPLESGEGYVPSIKTIHSGSFGIDLLPGNPTFAAHEDFLANEWKDVKSSELRGIKSTLLFSHLLSICQEYDYVLFDMGPSLGAINRSVLLACDYFLTPMSSDVFSLLALGNIGNSITKWTDDFNKGVKGLSPEKQAKIDTVRHFCSIKFLGFVEQQYIMKTIEGKTRAVRAYENILAQIPREIDQKIIKLINENCDKEIDYKIGSIPNFHSLVPMSQSAHKPIFSLNNSDGVVGAHYQKVKEFRDLMETVVDHAMINMEALND